MKAVPAEPLVTAIVLNWNSWDLTIRCVGRLSASDYGNLAVIVVDNGSDEEPRWEELRAFPRTTFMSTGRNLGYAGGNNQGIRKALEDGAQFVCLVNPDAIVESSCLSKLIAAMQSEPRIGIAGPKILFENRPDVLVTAGYHVVPSRGYVTVNFAAWQPDGPLFEIPDLLVDFVQGSCLMARRELIEDVGLIPEDHFLYWEEADWCHSARDKGWLVAVNQQARAMHRMTNLPGAEPRSDGAPLLARFPKVHGTEPPQVWYYYYKIRNHLLLVRKRCPRYLLRAVLADIRSIPDILSAEIHCGLPRALLVAWACITALVDGTIGASTGRHPWLHRQSAANKAEKRRAERHAQTEGRP